MNDTSPTGMRSMVCPPGWWHPPILPFATIWADTLYVVAEIRYAIGVRPYVAH